MATGGKIVGEFRKSRVDRLLTAEASETAHHQRVRHFLQTMEAAVLEANCEVFRRELPNLTQETFLRMAIRTAELRADYIRTGIQVAESRDPDQHTIEELSRLRQAFEEMKSVFEAAERLVERGYVTLD